MAMTREQLLEKIKGLGSKGGRNKHIWKATDKHVIRLLPLEGKDEEPWHTVGSHYVNNKYIYCVRTRGEDCPVCEFADKLKSFFDDDGNKKPKHVKDADWEIFKKIQAGENHWFAVIERKRDKDKNETIEGPFWWKTPKTLLGEVLKICADEGWNEQYQESQGDGTGLMQILFDKAYALDVDVDFQQALNKDGKGNEKQFPITEIKEKKRFTPISKDRDEVTRILEAIPAFDEVVKPMTLDEVNKIWGDIIASGGPTAEDKKNESSDGTEVGAKGGDDKVDTNSAEEPAGGKENVSDAVQKLLNKKK
jgi:hypothetical protein